MTTAGRTAASARFAWRCAVGVAVTEAGDCVCVERTGSTGSEWEGRRKNTLRWALASERERREAGMNFPRGYGTAATLASDGHFAAEVGAMTMG